MVVPVPAHSEHTLGGHGHAAGVAGGGHLFRSGVLLAIGSRSVSTLSFAMANGARGSRAGVASLSSLLLLLLLCGVGVVVGGGMCPSDLCGG